MTRARRLQFTSAPVSELGRPRRIFVVGIGGAGLNAIARVLAGLGHTVSGSDQTETDTTRALVGSGIPVHIGHRAENVADAELVLVSAAIPSDNPEVAEALRLGIPAVRREALLPALLESKRVVAVAGSHGKTTVTGMIALGLRSTGCDPSYIVGGTPLNLDSSGVAGAGRDFVIEADEYQRAFLCLAPDVAVITNVEMDHPDCFAGAADLESAFAAFAERVNANGVIIACGDNAGARAAVARASLSSGTAVQWYGVGPDCEWQAWARRPVARGAYCFEVGRHEVPLGRLALSVPGAHNVPNALAAFAVLTTLGLSPQEAALGIMRFGGMRRRFELLGTSLGVTVIDDYAHHPSQIAATLSTARDAYLGARVWVVFQPHTFSRLKALWQGFADSLAAADRIVVLPVYAAREIPDPSVQPELLVPALGAHRAWYAESVGEAAALLSHQVVSGDVVLTLGAGDEYKAGHALLSRLGHLTAGGLSLSEDALACPTAEEGGR